MAVEAALGVIDRHFAAENAHDVEATLATYTEDIVWDDVTHPASPFQGKQAVAQAYGGILEAIPDLNLRSVQRFSVASTSSTSRSSPAMSLGSLQASGVA